MTHTIIAIFPYALFALGLIGSLALFLSMKRELHRQAAKNRVDVDELARKFDETPSAPSELIYIPASPRSGLNMSKRVQAMRMVRRKEDVSHIAAALGVTRTEIELLIRVQRISSAG